MSEQDKVDLFAAWLEGELTSSQQNQFESLCKSDADFAMQVEQANYVNILRQTSSDKEAPAWNKELSFQHNIRPNNILQSRWWQWQGLPITSLACSVFAIVMVVSGFNFEMSQGRMSMGFSKDSISEDDIAAMLETRITNYQQTNQMLLAQYIEAMQSQQLQASTQLTEYLLTSSRKERREDFAELIAFVNEQRRDDQVFYARQINDLKQDINSYGIDEGSAMLTPFVSSSDTAINE
jgi:hypothetical protein